MTSKQFEREEAILDVCESWAYRYSEEFYLISFWELADNLNNMWEAYLFVSEKHKQDKYYGENYWAIANYNLNKFKQQLAFTINRMCNAETIKQGYNDFYKIPIDMIPTKCSDCNNKYFSTVTKHKRKKYVKGYCASCIRKDYFKAILVQEIPRKKKGGKRG